MQRNHAFGARDLGGRGGIWAETGLGLRPTEVRAKSKQLEQVK